MSQTSNIPLKTGKGNGPIQRPKQNNVEKNLKCDKKNEKKTKS